MSSKPKPAFYLAIFAVVIALVGLAIWRFGSGGADEAGGGKTTADGGKAPNLTKEEMDQIKHMAEADTTASPPSRSTRTSRPSACPRSRA
jgi:hypothetical protein